MSLIIDILNETHNPGNLLSRDFCIVHSSPDCEHHGHKACRSPHKIGDGFRQKYPGGSKSPNARKEQSERNHNDHLAEEGEEDGLFGSSQGSKCGLAGKLQGHHEESEEIDFHGWYTQTEKFRFAVEYVNQRPGTEEGHGPAGGGYDDTGRSGEADCGLYPVIFSCPVVKAHDRLGPAA